MECAPGVHDVVPAQGVVVLGATSGRRHGPDGAAAQERGPAPASFPVAPHLATTRSRVLGLMHGDSKEMGWGPGWDSENVGGDQMGIPKNGLGIRW